MTHAILILAHKNLGQLIPLVGYFAMDCQVFIHIDQKCTIDGDVVSRLKSHPWVHVFDSRFDIHWGGFTMLKVELVLLSMVLKECNTDYIHLISGQDYPVKPLHTFLQFFDRNNEVNFIEYKPYPFNTREPARYSQGKFYLPYDFVDGRKPSGIAVAEKWAERQTHGGRIRPDGCPFPHRYKGSQWFSVTRNAVEELLRFTDNGPSFLLSLRYTFAPEEIYVPTVLVGLLPGKTIANDNLRYVRWKMENHSNPANLGIEHFGELSKSTAFFARKMQPPYCTSLIESINQYLLRK